jgi:hypothetical protein
MKTEKYTIKIATLEVLQNGATFIASVNGPSK